MAAKPMLPKITSKAHGARINDEWGQELIEAGIKIGLNLISE